MLTTLLPQYRFTRDHGRQLLNIALAAGQVVAIAWSTTHGFAQDSAERAVTSPPVVPALYTFAVWGVIYAGSLAYGVYQALPAQRERDLHRRVGSWTIGTFTATTVWAVAAGSQWNVLTVPAMFAMFGTLLGAFVNFSREHAPRSAVDRWLVVAPLSIFLGYVTLATIANTASLLTQYGVHSPLGLSDSAWAAMMLSGAGLVGAGMTGWSRGNPFYALTITWALIGVTVANVVDVPNLAVALTAGGAALTVTLALRHSQALRHTRRLSE